MDEELPETWGMMSYQTMTSYDRLQNKEYDVYWSHMNMTSYVKKSKVFFGSFHTDGTYPHT